MARPPRVGADGSIFHVTSRGNRRQLIFLDSADRLLFLRLLDRTVARFDWRCHAYCLMGNHYHLVIETPVFNLSEGMQRLNSRFAQLFNVNRGLDGHLFQGRFHSESIDTDGHFLWAVAYAALNPVRAGLVGDPSAWPWSSHRVTAGLERRPPLLTVERVWRSLAAEDRIARERYVRLVADVADSAAAGV